MVQLALGRGMPVERPVAIAAAVVAAITPEVDRYCIEELVPARTASHSALLNLGRRVPRPPVKR